jgi:hypothetical protein
MVGTELLYSDSIVLAAYADPHFASLVRSGTFWKLMSQSKANVKIEDGSDRFEDHIPAPIKSTPSAIKKWIRRLLVSFAVFLLLVAAGIFVLLELAKHEPEFYRNALRVDEKQQQANGSEMETRILNLRNSVLSESSWSASFTEEQINGWLAWDLNKKFPDLIPPEVSDPRVKVRDQSVTFAFRCEAKPFRGIAIINADVFLTGVVNQVGIRIISIHSGMVPVPVAAFADQIAIQAKKSGFNLEWSEENGATVAIIDLPDKMIKPDDGGSYIELKSVQITDKGISISGETHPPNF